MGTEGIDGRRLRSERSRLAVIEAMLRFYDAGVVKPSVAQIADASGVSERSVFRLFTDLEDLAASALERMLAEVLPFFTAPSSEGTLEERIVALVDQRSKLFGRIGNLARAAAFHAIGSPTIANAVAERRALLRNQVADQFAPELAALDAKERRILLAQLDQATSIEAFDYLRSPTGGRLSAANLRLAVAATLTALVEAARAGALDPSP